MKRNIVLLIGAMIVLLFTLSGCSTYGALEGEVINKEYKKAYCYSTIISTGKIMKPVLHYVPEQYKIEISKKENEEIKTKWIGVSQEKYEKIEIGDWYYENN